MAQAIQLFGLLILAVLGFVLPIMAILLSVFREGRLKLTAQYEAERIQTETNITEQLKKLIKKRFTSDGSAILKNLKALKAIKKTAGTKLSYLNPKQQTIRLFLPLIIAFSAVASSFLVKPNIQYLLLSIGIAGFTYAIVALIKSISVIVEVKSIIDADKKDADAKTVELLSEIAQKVGETKEQNYLQDVHIKANGKSIRDGPSKTIEVAVNKKYELELGMTNSEDRMAKNVEVGFIFPVSYMIDKGSHTIYRDEEKQIIRYATSYIHGNTTHPFSGLKITPLEQGDHTIRTFIKAENIRTIYRDFTLRVVE